MALILNLETATKCCSVCLAENGKVISIKEEWSDKYSHAEQINLFIEDVLKEAGHKLNDLDAIAISAGPGSYTGLRIGTSTAKGICYALGIPLISVNSLKALAAQMVVQGGLICPMFDARRMEVYCALYNDKLEEIQSTDAIVIDEASFSANLQENQLYFIGPGAEKCKDVLNHSNAVFDEQFQVSAKGMVALSQSKFDNEDFEDVAYFEPAYLKDFIAGTPKKLL